LKQFLLHITWLLVLLFSASTMVSAQSKTKSKLGSFNKRSASVSAKSVKNNLLYAEKLFNDSLSTALTIIEDNIMLAVKSGYKNEEALGYRILGDFNYKLSSYNLATSNYKKAIKLQSELNNTSVLASLYLKAGDVDVKTINYKKSIKNYTQAYQLFKQVNNIKNEIFCEHKLAKSSLKLKFYTKAQSYYQSAQRKAEKAKLIPLQIESILGVGKTQQLLGNTMFAETNYKLAKRLAEQNNLDNLTNKAYNLLTNLYNEQQKNSQGIEMQQQAYDYNFGRSNSNELIQNTTNLSREFVKQGDTKRALDLLNTNQVQIENSVTNQIDAEVQLDYFKTLAEVYETEGLVDKANVESNKYKVLVDSLVQLKVLKKHIIEDKAQTLQLSEKKMLLMEKDRELNEKRIALLKREQAVKDDAIQKQLIISYLLLGGLIIIGLLAFFLFRSRKQEQKNNKLLVLKSLRSQMNPHFIFNSLNSVNSFIAKKDERSANKYLAEFSKLMREVLECSQQDFIPLSKEVHILKLYLNLEHFRFNSHFDFTFEVDSNINLDDYQIPPMLLQPFIENAIWHGLRYKDTKGHLWVKFSQTKDCVAIEISDNGIGRKASAKVKTINQKKMKSTGIKNIENRLEIIRSVFKKNLDISIQDYDLTNETGTKVNVKLH